VIGEASGYGRYTFTVDSLLRTAIISVEIDSNESEDIIAQAYVEIPPVEPELLLYEHHPLYGVIFSRALPQNITVSSGEAVFGAYPFFLSGRTPYEPNIQYTWRMGGRTFQNPSTFQNVLTLRPSGQSGSVHIEVSVTHALKLLQEARKRSTFLVP
jgi:hypothetical protein